MHFQARTGLMAASVLLALAFSWDDSTAQQDSAVPPSPHLVLVRVIDTDGKAIAGAQIETESHFASAGKSGRTYTTDTGGQAVVEFPHDATQAVVVVTKPKFVQASRSWNPGRGLMIPDEVTLELSRGARIGGVVVNERDEPIERVRVELYFTSPPIPFAGRALQRPALFITANKAPLTDAAGRWHFDEAPETGNIGVRLIHPDYCSDPSLPGRGGKGLPQQLRDQTAELVMQDGVSATGLVTDLDGKPISNASVVMELPSGYSPRHRATTSDPDGRYRLPALPPGEYKIAAAAEGFAPLTQKQSISEFRSTVDFQLQPGRKIQLRVTDLDDHAVRAAVQVRSQQGDILESVLSIGDPARIPFATDPQGEYVWDHAPPGILKFVVFAEGFEADSVEIGPNDAEKIVRLKPLTRWTARVVDRVTGVPLSRFKVTPFRNNSPIQRGRSIEGAGGVFLIKPEQMLGDDMLLVEAAGHRTLIVELSLDRASPDEELRWALEPAGDVHGTVVDDRGEPVANAAISIRPTNLIASLRGRIPPEFDQLFSDREGRFQFPAQHSDFLMIVVSPRGFMHKEFDKTSGELGQIQLQPNSQIRGQVNSQGLDLLEVRVRVSCAFGADEIAVGDDGAFEFSTVPPGEVALTVMYFESGAKSPADVKHVSESLQLKSGDTAKVTIDLK